MSDKARDKTPPVDRAAEQPADRSQSTATPEEQFPHQPHGRAGQPDRRPASEGHESVTPIQPDEQGTEVGVSPTEAVTHGEPQEVVGTEYTGRGHGHTHDGEHGDGEPERGHSGQPAPRR